jgi:small-conductance mechanosensitive channel
VAAGTDGGLLNLILFVALFVVAFSQLGRARERATEDSVLQRLTWVLGTLLFTHAVAFFGIAYFDQSQFIWYAELAMITTAVTLTPQAAFAESAESVATAWNPWRDEPEGRVDVASAQGSLPSGRYRE